MVPRENMLLSSEDLRPSFGLSSKLDTEIMYCTVDGVENLMSHDVGSRRQMLSGPNYYPKTTPYLDYCTVDTGLQITGERFPRAWNSFLAYTLANPNTTALHSPTTNLRLPPPVKLN